MTTSPSDSPLQDRLYRLRSELDQNQIVLLSDPHDLRYFTGFITLTPFEREAFCLVSAAESILLLSAFSHNQPVTGLKLINFFRLESVITTIKQIASPMLSPELFLSTDHINMREYLLLQSLVPLVQIAPNNHPAIARQRLHKDAGEIASLSSANKTTHQAINYALSHLKVGMSEQDIQDIVEQKLRTRPSTPLAFPTIVAFGENSAKPHHQPTTRRLKNNDVVLIDCGASMNGYCADATRTIWFGDQPDPEFIQVENVVKKAYSLTLETLTSKCKAQDLDRSCRSFIEAQGYGDQFIHTTGHGVGLYIHETPSISSKDETVLESNMVITIEPGIYVDGKFGYRFENSVLITNDGYKELGISG